MAVTAIRVDANREIGFGHVERALTVAAELVAQNHQPVFVTREPSLTKAHLAKRGVTDVVTFHKAEEEADAILSAGPGLVILDVGATTHARVEPLKSAGCFLVTFDDLGDGRYLADIVVDANLTPANNPQKLKTTTRYLLGHDYVMLSPACRAARRKRRLFRPLQSLLVSGGGSDPTGVTPHVIRALDAFDTEIDVDVVVGPGFAHARCLNEALLAASRAFTIVEAPDDLPRRLRTADLGVLSGGITFFEAAHLGLPAVVIAQNKAQETNIAPFVAAGLTVSLGLASDNPYDRLPDAIRELAAPEKRQAISRALMKRVDGKGALRLAAAIKELLGQ